MENKPIVPLQDGVMVCIDKKTNTSKWVRLENVHYMGEPLKDYLAKQDARIKELEEARIADNEADLAWKEQTNELLAKIIAEIEKGE